MPDTSTSRPPDGAAELSFLSGLDASGFPAGPGETLDEYLARLRERRGQLDRLDRDLREHETVTLFGTAVVSAADRIPDDVVAEAAAITEPLYGFSFREFPGFFLSRSIGWLWGGCMICDTDIPLSVFFIRASFRNRRRFFIYDRRELLAHELCHSFRQELRDTELEEFFAYQTSPSRLRRYLGNCFIRQRDALLFTIPALLLMITQTLQSFVWPRLPVWPFWAAALGYPLWLLLRNAAGRAEYFRAHGRLLDFGVRNPRAVLFRMTGDERRAVGTMKRRSELEAMADGAIAAGEVRWRVIRHRFLQSATV